MKLSWTQLFIAALLIQATPAIAQTPWKSPHGNFTLTIPSEWRVIPPENVHLGTKSVADLMIEPAGESGPSSNTGCGVFRLNHSARAELSQSVANATLEKWDKEYFLAENGLGGNKLSEVGKFENKIHNGVRAVSMTYVIDIGGVRLRYWQSQFMLSLGGNRAAFFTLSCFTPASEKNAAHDSAAGAFKSLRFK